MNLTILQSWLAIHEWQSSFDERTLQRAGDYARRGRVHELELQPAGAQACKLSAAVAGSGGIVYECRVHIALNEPWLLLETDCSCPVGVDCKHAAAMLFSAASRGLSALAPDARAPVILPAWLARLHALKDEQELSSWDQWLASLDRVSSTMPGADPERRFGVLLRGDDTQRRGLMALPVWLRPSKSRNGTGALVDPQPLRLDDHLGAVPAPAEGWPEPVATALTVLLAAPTAYHRNAVWLSIRSVHTERALEQVLAHYPAWHERGNQPIERGPVVPATLEWIEAADGSQRLRMNLDAGDSELLVGASLWYVQPKTARYGRVDGDAQLFEQLGSAPVLQPQQLAAVRQRLATSAAGRRLPAPVERGVDEDVDARVAVLRLELLRVLDHPGDRAVDFDHEARRVRVVGKREVVLRLVPPAGHFGRAQDAAQIGRVARLEGTELHPLRIAPSPGGSSSPAAAARDPGCCGGAGPTACSSSRSAASRAARTSAG